MSNNHANKRHVAKIANTDQRCVVAFMQIPGREDHALVIPTDNLPSRYEQAVMSVLESNEGQSEETLAMVLGRRLMPDNGKSVLETLHQGNYMTAVPVSQVVMFPRPNMPFPLVDILRGMGKLPNNFTNNQNTNSALDTSAATQKYNQHAANLASLKVEEKQGIARGLIFEAELLENEAKQKREKAYLYSPEMRPSQVVLPTYNEDVKLDIVVEEVQEVQNAFVVDEPAFDAKPFDATPFDVEHFYSGK